MKPKPAIWIWGLVFLAALLPIAILVFMAKSLSGLSQPTTRALAVLAVAAPAAAVMIALVRANRRDRALLDEFKLHHERLSQADLSQRKRTEEALSQQRFLVETLMDHIPDHIYFKDRQSRFIRINRAMAQRFGLGDPAKAIGKTDFDFFTAEHAQQAFDDEQEIVRTGKSMVDREEKETWP